MSLQQAKNALVASLFELSNAATEAATATVNFYKAAGIDGADVAGASLSTLGDALTGAVQAAADGLPENGVHDKEPPKEEKTDKLEKPKKKRAEKDPNAPKKPLTSYLRFNISVRDEERKKRFENGLPTYPATELNQIIADRWAKLSAPEKEKLQKAYEGEYETYKKALEAYNAKKDGALLDAAPETKPPVAAAPKEKKKRAKKADAAPAAEAEDTKLKDTKPDAKADTKSDAKADAKADTKDEAAPPKKTKKRKDKDGDEKKSKKKKSE